MLAPYLPSLAMRIAPLPDQLLPITFWYGALHRRQRHPDARHALGPLQLDAGGDFEGAPAGGLRVEGQLLGEGEARQGGERGSRGAGLDE